MRVHNQIFVSYSHKDKVWLDRLKTNLKPLNRNSALLIWDDSAIKPGEKWKDAITLALKSASMALLLVSREFLASDFIHFDELGPILNDAERDGVKVLWILIEPCAYEGTTIRDYQALHDISKSLAELSGPKLAHVLKAIAAKILEALPAPNP